MSLKEAYKLEYIIENMLGVEDILAGKVTKGRGYERLNLSKSEILATIKIWRKEIEKIVVNLSTSREE